MIVELDMGNTRIKWRQLLNGDEKALSGAVETVAQLVEVSKNWADVTQIRLANVRGERDKQGLDEWAGQRWGVNIEVAKVVRSCGGVTNCYSEVERLGVDRWLAMLAAYQRANGACVVIDFGTAVTVDVIDAQGLHRGGYICPGVNTMAKALLSNTHIKVPAMGELISVELGCTTQEAIIHGANAALLGMINNTLKKQEEEYGGGIIVYLTGGDGEKFAAHLAETEVSKELVPSLVLDGLVIALADNIDSLNT